MSKFLLLAMKLSRLTLRVRYFRVRVFVLLTVISLLPLLNVHANTLLPKPRHQSPWDHRYIIFLDGIRSSSSGTTPLSGDFEFIENALIKEGIANSNIAYFSYSATAKLNYCEGWRDACLPNKDLSYLHLFPVYGIEDTQLRITHQAETLKWLIGQIIKKDASAHIDLIGFSQGGLIAAYLGSKTSVSSPLHSHIHAIIAIESPLGGIPAAAGCLDEPGFNVICPSLKLVWGDEFLRALQLPDTLAGSIVDELPNVAENFRFISIQSTTDYTVNDEEFPIDWPAYGHQDALIGRGSQYWLRSKQTIYDKDELGGNGLATDYIGWTASYRWIQTNHYAPLREQQTVDWIIDTINEPAVEASQESPPELPSLPAFSWEEWREQFENWWRQLQDSAKDDFNQWWQEQLKNIEDTVNRWLQEQQEKAIEWLFQRYMELLNQCFGSALLPAGALAIMRISRRKKGKVLK